jgi:hypothetical protein
LIDLASRRVQVVGSTPHPDERFMRQVGRSLMAVEDGALRNYRVLLCDRERSDLLQATSARQDLQIDTRWLAKP